MALTSKQRKQLRGMANTREAILIIGKDNVNEGVVAQADEALEALELVKCSVLETSDLTAREAATELAKRAGAECVQVIGRRFVLYRRSSRKGVKHIDLNQPTSASRPKTAAAQKAAAAARANAAESPEAAPRLRTSTSTSKSAPKKGSTKVKVSAKARAAAKAHAVAAYNKAHKDDKPRTFTKAGGPKRASSSRPSGKPAGRSSRPGGAKR